MQLKQKVETLSYRGMKFEVPIFGTEGLVLSPQEPKSSNTHSGPIYEDTNSIWDLKKFETASRTPLICGKIADTTRFSKPSNLRVLDMPIKFPGSDVYRVPKELGQFGEAIQFCADQHHKFNPRATEYYAYITVDQGVVKKGCLQRNSGCHVDGFQGSRIEPKVMVNQSYLCTDSIPAVFYPHPFSVKHLDASKDNFFLEFDRQSDEQNSWQAKPFEVLLMDAYCVHRSTAAETDHYRTFFRLTYEVRKFDRLGNAHNPLFDYSWDMVPRDIHSTLREYKNES